MRPPIRNRFLQSIALLAVTAGGLWLIYGRTLTLPYFWDDAPHFRQLVQNDYRAIWTNAIGYRYYRPLIFTIYKAAFDALPFGATLLPRGSVLLLHALNSVLCGAVARQLWERKQRGRDGTFRAQLLTTAAFALYPFAALPVLHVAAAGHLLITLCALIGVLAIWRFASVGRVHWYLLAALAALAAPYLQESGVMVGALIALAWLVETVGQPRSTRPLDHWRIGRARRRARVAVLLVLPALSGSFVAVWSLIPKPRSDNLTLDTWDVLLAKFSFFWQALTYPLQPAAAQLIERSDWWDLAVILSAGALVVLLSAVYLVPQGHGRTLVLALGWVVLAMLPAVAGLSFGYLVTSPRLLYFPAVSGALLCGSGLAAVLSARRWRPLQRTLAVGGLALTLLVPAVYLVRVVNIHRQGLGALQQMLNVVRNYPADRHLFVNPVEWVAFEQAWYPLGHDGVTLTASYMPTTELFFANLGVWPEAEFVTFGELRQPLDGRLYATLGEREGLTAASFAEAAQNYQHIWLTTAAEREFETRRVGSVTTQPAAASTADVPLVTFESAVALQSATHTHNQEAVTVTLEWVVLDDRLRPDANAFRHVLSCDGELIGNGSGYPVGAMVRLDVLPAGTRVEDVWRIPLDAPLADECYRVAVGLFTADGARLTAVAADGSAVPDGAFQLAP